MHIDKEDIKKYVEGFLNGVFNEKIFISIQDDFYVLNNKKRFKIYDFWNKSDSELINDFKDFSFKNDYIGTIFFFLSGYWEYTHNNINDSYKRFPAKESFGFKKGILEQPVVDILIKRISKKFKIGYNNNFINPKLFITHDIDRLKLLESIIFIKLLAKDILKNKDIKAFIDKIIKKILMQDPYSPSNLVNIHKKNNSKGTFFFLPDNQFGIKSSGYNPLSKRRYLRKLQYQIVNSNGTIGLHYDHRYLEDDRMTQDIELLNKVFGTSIRAGRAHYLLFDITKTFDILEKSGIKLDTTCSYADMVGFRFGTSYPFKPYNFKENRIYRILEVPLIVMEDTLQNENYMNLSPGEGFEKIKKLMDLIKRYNGIFTFLWHNSSFYTKRWKEWEWVFKEVIKYGKNNGFIFVNSDEILEQFSNKGYKYDK